MAISLCIGYFYRTDVSRLCTFHSPLHISKPFLTSIKNGGCRQTHLQYTGLRAMASTSVSTHNQASGYFITSLIYLSYYWISLYILFCVVFKLLFISISHTFKNFIIFRIKRRQWLSSVGFSDIFLLDVFSLTYTDISKPLLIGNASVFVCSFKLLAGQPMSLSSIWVSVQDQINAFLLLGLVTFYQ